MKKPIETRGHIIGFKEEIASIANDDDKFFGWFDNKKSFKDTYSQAAWDFSWHIAVPLTPFMKKPGAELTALEIGVGGGRLLAQAARYFRLAIGTDIHENLPKVEAKLKELGLDNVEMRQGDGRSLPCADNEVDVIYSFIVFQHLEKISILENYVREMYRILRPGGIAVIYAGRLGPNSLYKTSRLLFLYDVFMEKFRLPKGYLEKPAPVNHTNLLVSRAFMKNLAEKSGFTHLESRPSRRNLDQGARQYGGQHGFIWRKPE